MPARSISACSCGRHSGAARREGCKDAGSAPARSKSPSECSWRTSGRSPRGSGLPRDGCRAYCALIQRSCSHAELRDFNRGLLGVWGAISWPPRTQREIEERHGFAGARRTLGVWGAISWPPMSMSPKRRHDLRREALELLENHRLGRADRLADVDDLQACILFLDVFQLLGDLFWRADEPRAGLDRVAQGRQPGLTRALGVGDRVDLRRRQARYEAERREHLDVLLEERRRLLDALLDAVGDVERKADAEVAAQLGFPPGAGTRLAERVHDLLVGAALRSAATDDALDVVLGH